MRVLDSDPAVMRFTPARIPQSEAQTRDRIRAQVQKQRDLEPFGIWLAEEKQTGDFIGWFMLLPTQTGELELGFMLVSDKWNRGFATEVGRALMDFAQSNKAVRIFARTSLDNIASIRVLEKLGFLYSRKISVTEAGFEGQIELKVFEIEVG